MNGNVERLYADKTDNYYTNARHDMVAMLETIRTSAILEIGCGSGGTGVAALAAGKAGRYVGIELMPEIAEEAKAVLSEVIVGNVEHMDLSAYAGQFDALILSEVLEHLVDPWGTVTRLAACLRPGGAVLASSPNVSHRSMIVKLFNGYETVLTSQDDTLDAGQRFRLGLARAIVRNPALLIIEEPSAVLDEDTKTLLIDAYDRICRERTVIFLPKRMSTVRRADQIVVLHDGKVAAIGPHSKLVTQSTIYRHWEYMHFNEFRHET